MKTSREYPKLKLYMFLLAVQISGAVTFVCQQLPEFRQIAFNPGTQLPQDPASDLITIAVLLVMQISFWYRVHYIPIPFRHPNMLLNHMSCFWAG
jgi:hypothetical protein